MSELTTSGSSEGSIPERIRAFSSEVATGSREENATKQGPRAFLRFNETQKCSSPNAPPYAEGPNRITRGLTMRQATVTFVIVLLLGLITSSIQLFVEWQAERERIVAATDHALDMISASAVEAAYQMNGDLAKRVVDGLFQEPAIAQIVLRDNFGNVLAARSRQTEGGEQVTFSGTLFSDLTGFSRQLTSGEGANRAFFGTLALRLSANVLGYAFLDRVLVNLALFIIQGVVVCGLVVMVFYLMITKPITRIARDIGRVEPGRPASALVRMPRYHETDELGFLTGTLNRLLRAAQDSLDRREAAERDLRALTLDLERRVAERTRDLEQTLAQLNIEKEETERAFRKLDRANSLILESIHYARKIQDSLLPDKRALDGAITDLHVIWEPLHLVGGDYFWLEQIGDKSLIFIADCTGHGVPGAFMTMVVASALDIILHQDHEVCPAHVLERLDDMVRARLRQDRPETSSDDGLDAAFCVYDRTTKRLSFAGANIGLLYGDATAWMDVRGDRTSLGYRHVRQRGAFTHHDIAVATGTTFYLFTDGVPDHMGGMPRRLLGRKRLAEILTGAAGATLADRLGQVEAQLEAYRGCESRRDDMTIIAFIPQ